MRILSARSDCHDNDIRETSKKVRPKPTNRYNPEDPDLSRDYELRIKH